MTQTIEELEERYLEFYCELGMDHPDTREAKRQYFARLKEMEEEGNGTEG